MSMICCEDCSRVLDTDESPEVFRDDMDWAALCDACYDARLDELEGIRRVGGGDYRGVMA